MQEHYYQERLISIAIYAIIAAIFCIQLRRKDARTKRILFMYTIVLTILAYFFKPTQTMDLYRLWLSADYYNSGRNLLQLFQVAFERWDSPLGLVFVAGISRIDYNLVPAVAAFIFYINIFHIIGDYSEKNDISNIVTGTTVLFFMSRGVYVEVISGIRCMMAFSIVARCVYDEVYREKGLMWHIPLYLTASLLHSTAIVAIAIRFLVYTFLEQKGVRRIAYTAVIAMVVGLFISFFGANFLGAMTKAEGYLTNETYSFMAEYILQGAFTVVCVLIACISSRRHGLSDYGRKNRIMYLTVVILCIASVSVYSIFHRFLSFASMIVLPIILEVLGSDVENKSNTSCNNLLILSCIMMFFSGLFGNLNGLKFFG